MYLYSLGEDKMDESKAIQMKRIITLCFKIVACLFYIIITGIVFPFGLMYAGVKDGFRCGYDWRA